MSTSARTKEAILKPCFTNFRLLSSKFCRIPPASRPPNSACLSILSNTLHTLAPCTILTNLCRGDVNTHGTCPRARTHKTHTQSRYPVHVPSMSLTSVYLKPGDDCTEALARRGLVAERGSSKIALNCGFILKQADRSVIEPCGHT